MSERHRDSLVVHAGADVRVEGFRGTSPAIEASSAFTADSVEELYGVFRGKRGVVYSRLGNPTVMVFEHALAALEGAAGAVAFGSGMAAIHGAWLACGLERDDLVVASRDCYGSTLTLLQTVARLGVRERRADLCDTMNACALIAAERPKIVHCEVVSNPLLRVPDIDALAEAAKGAGARLVIDATFATPMLFRPFEHGTDIVVHSATKYLGGHGDLIGGICASRDAGLCRALRQAVIVAGAVLSPFDAWLALRGMRTLALRMQRACDNARAVAAFLDEHPRVARVHYPGLSHHPHHARAQRLLREQGGAMIAFELGEGTRESAMAMLERLELIQPATTLGDVGSLALHPATSSHRELEASELVVLGIDESLLRLSIGIENAADIIADLERALAP